MKVKFRASATSGPLPDAYYTLQAAIDMESNHVGMQLRHPFSLYVVSLGTIVERATTVLDLIEPLYYGLDDHKEHRNKHDGGIRAATDAFLDALMEHYDDCKSILNCYGDSQTKSHKKAMELFKANSDSYRNHVAKIVNYIKHRQRRIRVLVFYGNDWSTPGYFIEGPVDHSTIGPDASFHPNSNSAYSFRRDIAFHLCGIYFVARSMKVALSKIDERFHHSSDGTKSDPLGNEWLEMLTRVSKLDARVFPDELKKPFPRIEARGSDISIEYPAEKSVPFSVPTPSQVTLLFTVDPVSRGYRMPYFTS